MMIVVSGKQKSGKDTVAEILMEQFSSIKRVGLADELKRMVAKVRGITVEELESNKAKYRGDLIFAGQIGRELNEYTWVDLAEREVMYNSDMGHYSIITDVRFPNELRYFTDREDAAWTIRVKAPDSIRINRGANPEFFKDISETALDEVEDEEFDFVVRNDGTYEELLEKIEPIVNRFKEMGVQ